MSDVVYRTLLEDELAEARQLSSRNPDVFGSYALGRLPSYYEIADALERIPVFVAKQRLMLGAFKNGYLVGAIFVASDDPPVQRMLTDIEWLQLHERFPEDEINVFTTLTSDLSKSVIPNPNGGLLIHSLWVDRAHRREGIATHLLQEAIARLSSEELNSLYIKVAWVRHHVLLCKSLGFRIVDKRRSLSLRIQFGCWGSLLCKFDSETNGQTDGYCNSLRLRGR